jgi:hypothetical protein
MFLKACNQIRSLTGKPNAISYGSRFSNHNGLEKKLSRSKKITPAKLLMSSCSKHSLSLILDALTMTPPFNIWAKPCFTVVVPTRALPLPFDPLVSVIFPSLLDINL